MTKAGKSISTITIPKALNDELGQLFPYGQKGCGVEALLKLAVEAYKHNNRAFHTVFISRHNVYDQSILYAQLLKRFALANTDKISIAKAFTQTLKKVIATEYADN